MSSSGRPCNNLGINSRDYNSGSIVGGFSLDSPPALSIQQAHVFEHPTSGSPDAPIQSRSNGNSGPQIGPRQPKLGSQKSTPAKKNNCSRFFKPALIGITVVGGLITCALSAKLG